MPIEKIMYNSIISGFYTLYQSMEQIPINIILTDDLNGKQIELCPEYREKLLDASNRKNNEYNGRMVLSHSLDGTMNILINTKKMTKCISQCNYRAFSLSKIEAAKTKIPATP